MPIRGSAMLTISGRSVGSRKPLFDDFSIPPPIDPGEGGLTLRDFIARVVRSQVKAYQEREHARRFDRVLTARQIGEGQAKGSIRPEGRSLSPGPADTDEAVAAAWDAFEDGLYLVVIDGEEQKVLDKQVYVNEDSRVTFVRLVFLSGW